MSHIYEECDTYEEWNEEFHTYMKERGISHIYAMRNVTYIPGVEWGMSHIYEKWGMSHIYEEWGMSQIYEVWGMSHKLGISHMYEEWRVSHM